MTMLKRQRSYLAIFGIYRPSWRRSRAIRIIILATTFFFAATWALAQYESIDHVEPLAPVGYLIRPPRLVARLIGKGKELMRERGCEGWDPSDGEDKDPVNCLRARQYRQVQAVLEREIRGGQDNWYFTKIPNIATLQKLSKCYLPTSHSNYTSCPDRPLIINGYWWSAMTLHNATSGEAVWQASVHKEMDKFGIMSIFVGVYSNWVEVAEMMPDVYRFVWTSDADVVSCFTDPRCIAPEHYVAPEGSEDLSIAVPEEEKGVIPIWRLQVVDYWGSRPMEGNHGHFEAWSISKPGEWSYHSLGPQWVQTPFPLPNHVHIPYSIEEYCLNVPEIPHEEREDTVLVLAKHSEYFYNIHAPDIETWSDLANEPNFSLIATAEVRKGSPKVPDGLNSIGRQTREAYEGLVGSSKVLLGMGIPRISPSIYTALCQGTPVVLPYVKAQSELHKGGWEVFSVAYQHAPAMALGPPYVYSYQIDDYAGMVEQINQALTTPIGRYIPEDMRLPYVHAQIGAWLNRDLYKLFKGVIKDNGGEIPRLMAGLREQCRDRKRCAKPFLPGRRPTTPERWKERESRRKGEEVGLLLQ